MKRTPRRLRRRRDFLHVARAGRKWAAPGLVLQVLNRSRSPGRLPDDEVEEDEIRVGFTVTRRVGGAVTRNRARRRLRAAAETVMPAHAAGGHDYVVIGRSTTVSRPFAALVGDLETALRKLDAWREVAQGADGRERNDQ